MTRRSRFIVAGLLASIAVVPSLSASTPLPDDQRITKGKLANGVTWMYRKHDNPPGKMALMMHLRTGSLNETDAQQGLAHFIEHMCFNGSENFPPGELIPYFESIGMQFGADLNAFTSFDQTAYMLFTPDTTTKQVDRALTVLSDYAFRLLLLQEEIDKERGVILEESRTGKGASERLRKKVWPELFEGTRFANRLPIGKDEVIANVTRDEFNAFYRTWYRPENLTLVLVGDAEHEQYLPLIKKWFGEYKPASPSSEPMGPEFKPFTKQRAIVATDPEMAMCRIQMTNILPGRQPAVTVEEARVELIEYIGSWIIGRRFEERVNKGEASYRGAGASSFSFFNDAILVSASAGGEPQEWAKMLDELVTEVSRVNEYGFTERELALATKEILADITRAVKTEPTRNARGIVRQIVSAVHDRIPIMSAAQELGVYEKLLPSVNLAEVNTAFKAHFRPGTFAYVVQMVEKPDVAVPARDEVLATARAAWARKVEAPTEDDAPTALLAEMPTPGKVIESTTDKDLGITSAWLDNGVRLHHRYMDYKKDSVWVSISLAGGEIEETAKNAGVTEVAGLAINDAATSRLTSTNMRDLMTGKNINVRGGGRGDAFTLTITGSPEDLETGLQKAHALLTDGKIEQSAFKNWKLQSLQRVDMLHKMPRFKAAEALTELLSGGDPRREFPNKERVERQSIEAAQAWFDRLCREAPIEVAVVGDLSMDEAMPLVEKYIGSLSKRPRTAKHLDKLRRLARETGPLARHVEVDTITPQATGTAGFVGCEGRNTNDRRAMSVSSSILSSRLVKTIREDLSLVYSIRAGNRASWVYEDSGTFMAGAPCDPENVNQLADEIHKLFKAFADTGPTDEELANAKKQILEDLDTDMREPSFWFDILRNHDLHGRNYTEAKDVKEAYARFTIEQVRDVFRKYYTPERQFRVTAVPVKPEVTKEAPEEKKATSPAT